MYTSFLGILAVFVFSPEIPLTERDKPVFSKLALFFAGAKELGEVLTRQHADFFSTNKLSRGGGVLGCLETVKMVLWITLCQIKSKSGIKTFMTL